MSWSDHHGNLIILKVNKHESSVEVKRKDLNIMDVEIHSLGGGASGWLSQ